MRTQSWAARCHFCYSNIEYHHCLPAVSRPAHLDLVVGYRLDFVSDFMAFGLKAIGGYPGGDGGVRKVNNLDSINQFFLAGPQVEQFPQVVDHEIGRVVAGATVVVGAAIGAMVTGATVTSTGAAVTGGVAGTRFCGPTWRGRAERP